jgi:hypothetical protein
VGVSKWVEQRIKEAQVIQLATGLDKKTAYERAKKRATRDWRGFSYDPKTGIAKLI